jgi:ribosomal-protein-alanine N-acetyltransferase
MWKIVSNYFFTKGIFGYFMMNKSFFPSRFMKPFLLGILILCGVGYYFSSPVHIQYEINSQSLNVQITTPRLYARSVQESDRPYFDQLFSDPRVMDTLSDTTAFSLKAIDWIFRGRWLTKWRSHIPFSGFAVFDKKSRVFMGFMRIEKTGQPGQLEIAYALNPEHWNKGYGTEMVGALVHYYVPYLLKLGMTNMGTYPIEIIANCREDNKGSRRVLEKNQFVFKKKTLNKLFFSYKMEAA